MTGLAALPVTDPSLGCADQPFWLTIAGEVGNRGQSTAEAFVAADCCWAEGNSEPTRQRLLGHLCQSWKRAWPTRSPQARAATNRPRRNRRANHGNEGQTAGTADRETDVSHVWQYDGCGSGVVRHVMQGRDSVARPLSCVAPRRWPLPNPDFRRIGRPDAQGLKAEGLEVHTAGFSRRCARCPRCRRLTPSATHRSRPCRSRSGSARRHSQPLQMPR